jgi:hypothetical protein
MSRAGRVEGALPAPADILSSAAAAEAERPSVRAGETPATR